MNAGEVSTIAKSLRAELPPEVFTISSTTQELLHRVHFTHDEPVVEQNEGDQPEPSQEITATATALADVLPGLSEGGAELVCTEPVADLVSELVEEPVQAVSIDTIAEPVVPEELVEVHPTEEQVPFSPESSTESAESLPVQLIEEPVQAVSIDTIAEPVVFEELVAVVPPEAPGQFLSEVGVAPAEPLPVEVAEEAVLFVESPAEMPVSESPVVESAMPWQMSSFVINANEQASVPADLVPEAAGLVEGEIAPLSAVSTEESLPAEAVPEVTETPPVAPVLNLCSVAIVGGGGSTGDQKPPESETPSAPSNLDDFFAHYAALAEREIEKRSVSEAQEATEAFLSAVTKRGAVQWGDDSGPSEGQS